MKGLAFGLSVVFFLLFLSSLVVQNSFSALVFVIIFFVLFTYSVGGAINSLFR